MKFGACIGVRQAFSDYPTPSDYVELSASYIHSMEAERFEDLKTAVADGKIQTYSCNGLVIPSLRLTGQDVNFGAVKDYCDSLFEKLAELNIRMLVFGSGQAKHVPDGFPMEKAWDQLYEIGSIFSDYAAQYGQTVAVEPLSYNEVNIVNTVEDAAQYVHTVRRDNFKLLVDFYHFDNNGEDVASIRKHSDLLVHTHFCTAKTRTIPETEEDWAFVKRCIELLKEIGYTGGVSYEGKSHDPAMLNEMLLKIKAL